MRPTRLLVLVNVYRPDLGGGVLFADLCEGLVARGFEVTVRCAVPYYPEWKDKTGQNGLLIHSREEGGVTVERFGIFIPKRPNSLLSRLLYEASFFLSLARRLPYPGEFDMVMVYCPLVGAVAWGAVAARVCGAPLWLNVQDLSAEAAAASGIVRGSSAAGLLVGVQRWLFNLADTWSTISPVMARRLELGRRRDQPIHLLPNWLHATLADRIREHPGMGKPTARGEVRLLYSGNLGTKQDLLRLCEVLHASPVPFRFEIRGSGGTSETIRSWIEASGDVRFVFGALTDEAGLADALASTDLFVITETEGAGGSFIPSKMLPALAAGVPILAVCDPTTPFGEEMAESGAGPLVRWDDIETVPSMIENLRDRPDVMESWRHASRTRSQVFDRNHIIDRYAELLLELASGQDPVRR